jgi:hypothetical protein
MQQLSTAIASLAFVCQPDFFPSISARRGVGLTMPPKSLAHPMSNKLVKTMSVYSATGFRKSTFSK